MAQLLGVPAETITPGKMTYDLRRLRTHGLIERVPGTFRSQVNDDGITRALFLARLHDRFLRTGLAELAAPPGTNRSLAAASRLHQCHRRPRPASRLTPRLTVNPDPKT
jgi:hypothetical protein